MNAAVSAPRFFYKITLSQPGFGDRLANVANSIGFRSCLAPRMWRCCCIARRALKTKAALSVDYGGGLGASECFRLICPRHLWRDTGLWKKINHLLLMQARQAAGRAAAGALLRRALLEIDG